MKRITEGAFAKLNLTLDVLDRRAAGYHDISVSVLDRSECLTDTVCS